MLSITRWFILLPCLLTTWLAVAPDSTSQGHTGDLNGDGFEDLAIGVPNEGLALFAVGAVHAFYGKASGLSGQGNQYWHQNSPGVLDKQDGGDSFGSSLAYGDFNGDGFTDIGIGVSGDEPASPGGGAVQVLYGSNSGLQSLQNEYWFVGASGVPDPGSIFNYLGRSLAAGDFNGDGYDEILLGAPSGSIGFGGSAINDCGFAILLHGSVGGLSTVGSMILTQTAVLTIADEFDAFASAMVVADFNQDGFEDLAVGIPNDDPNGISEAGSVTVFYGSAASLSYANMDSFHQGLVGMQETAEAMDHFGSSLTAGDFDGDGFHDLVIGVPEETHGGLAQAGLLHILYGSATGLSLSGNQIWHQDSVLIQEAAEPGDRFGSALTAADYNGDGSDDLVVSSVGEENQAGETTGLIHLFLGSAGVGITATGNVAGNQDSPGVVGEGQNDGEFGGQLISADFNADGYADLVVSMRGQDITGNSAAGAVHLFYGDPASGLSLVGNGFGHQNTPTVQDQAEAFDGFGVLH